jgi:hypothetical protein
VVAAFAALAGCGGEAAERRPTPEPALRIWTSGLLRWEAGAPRSVDFAIENATRRSVAIAAPDPANARVDVFAGPGNFRVCGAAAAAPPAPGPRITLAPGDRVAVRVHLDGACAGVPSGEYRYEVSYRAAEAPGRDAFSGTLPTQYGQVLVSAPSPSAEAVAGHEGARGPEATRAAARRGRAERARRSARPDAGAQERP